MSWRRITPPPLLIVLASVVIRAAAAAGTCSSNSCQLLDACSTANDCAAGLFCGNCPVAGRSLPVCTRGQAMVPTSIVNGLPFNKYTWLVTHNAFSNLNEPSHTGTQRVTFYNQEDSVANQLRNGVRGFMLDMYDFEGDIWLCHSFKGQCFNFTAFGPAIDTLKDIAEFLSANPTEIVTIIIEDYVQTPKGLTKLFTNAGLLKYWFPVAEMPTNGADWPTVNDMAAKNHRLLVFTSSSSKEADEGIAYQWKYFLENEPGDPGLVQGTCPSRKESRPLNSKAASLILLNYFPTIPVLNEACKEHSTGLSEMASACYSAAGNLMPNFLAVNYYMRSDGGGVFDVLDRMNGQALCGCSTVAACQPGSPPGVCKNIGAPPSGNTGGGLGGTYSGSFHFKPSASSATVRLLYLSTTTLICSLMLTALHL